jgi:hypothetical protein
MTDQPYKIGDPVVDLAQGRPMIVLDAPNESVQAWSDREGYDLADNYANGKLGADPDETVVRCVYVSDIRSEPSKDYTFPVSRVTLIDVHHADDGRRVYDRVAMDILERLFSVAAGAMEPDNTEMLHSVCRDAGLDEDVVQVARELADVADTIGGDDGE